MASDGTVEGLLERERSYDDEVIGENTIPMLFEENTDRFGDEEAQLYKGGVYPRSLTPDIVPAPPDGEFGSITYERMGEIVRQLATGFRELGVSADEKVAMLADTRMEWGLSDLSILAAGGVVTTVYKESSPRQINYLVNHPGAVGVVCENEALLDRLVKIHSELDLDFVVVFDELDRYAGVDGIYTLADVYDLGADNYDRGAYDDWLDARNLDDLASLIYTSGTTGVPKGVMLTHENFRANLNQIRRRSGPRPDKRETDTPWIDHTTTTLSFLPLAHVFERTVGHFFMLASGATIGYAESTDTISEDIKKVEPNAAASVPRVYERIFAGMREEASGSAVSKRIFEWATDVAREYARTDDPSRWLELKHSVGDTLVYSSVKAEMGGEIEYFVSGGGTLNRELAEMFIGMGVPVYEGYGLTETSPVATTNPPESPQPGTLGFPVVDVDVRIDESMVDQEFEDAEGTVGEIQLRGPNVTEGYWQMPEKTADAFTDDGWFKTGDLVEQKSDGYLRYHDRLKNLLVLTTGKNVSPEPIEDEFATSPRIEQIMVIGDDQKFVAALIVPNFEAIREWASNQGIDLPDDEAEICEDERVNAWFREEIELVNRTIGDEEQIKRFELVGTEWTPENDLLTPSLKKKRRNILAAFDDKVAAIYGDSTDGTDEAITPREEPAAADD
jgi:long-chain acyl-CoA synthetase